MLRKAIRVLLVVAILLIGTVATPHLGGACQAVYPGDSPC